MESSSPLSKTFTTNFSRYFERAVAERAAQSLADGAEIEFRIAQSDGKVTETFIFTRKDRKNVVQAGSADEPQVIFTLTPNAAQELLDDDSEEIGHIGVKILKLIVSADAHRRIAIKIKAGFFTLFTKGYFGVISTGGSAFSSFLTSKGLDGMGAIQSLLKKIKG